MGLMLMVMIGCSNGYSSITPTIPMVHTETPAPTATPIPLPYDQGLEQVVDVLIPFNQIHNDFVVFMSTLAIFQNNNMLTPETATTIVLPALDIYENALISWRATEFKDSDWLYVNQLLNDIREAELEKTNVFRVLSHQLQDAYLQQDLNQIVNIQEQMGKFGESKTAVQTSLLQYQLLKKLSIAPDKVNFHYAEWIEEKFKQIDPPILDKVMLNAHVF